MSSSAAGIAQRQALADAHAGMRSALDCARRMLASLARRAARASPEERARLLAEVERMRAELQRTFELFRARLASAERARVDGLLACGARHAEAIRVERGAERVVTDAPAGTADVTPEIVAAMSSAGCARELDAIPPIETPPLPSAACGE